MLIIDPDDPLHLVENGTRPAVDLPSQGHHFILTQCPDPVKVQLRGLQATAHREIPGEAVLQEAALTLCERFCNAIQLLYKRPLDAVTLSQTLGDILHVVGGHLPDVGRLVEIMTEARPRVGDVEDVAHGTPVLVQEPDALCLVLDIAGKPRVPKR